MKPARETVTGFSRFMGQDLKSAKGETEDLWMKTFQIHGKWLPSCGFVFRYFANGCAKESCR